MSLTPKQADYEAQRRDELFEIAKFMTSIGLEGEDPDDPNIQNLMRLAEDKTETHEEFLAFIKARWKTR